MAMKAGGKALIAAAVLALAGVGIWKSGALESAQQAAVQQQQAQPVLEPTTTVVETPASPPAVAATPTPTPEPAPTVSNGGAGMDALLNAGKK